MTKARTLANFISDNNEFADGTISVSEVSGAAPLASPSFTGTPKSDTFFEIEGADNALLTLDETNGVAGGAQSTYISMQAGGAQTAYLGVASSGGIYYVANKYGPIQLMTGPSGTETSKLLLGDSGEAVFNEGGADYDFRVESDTVSHMFFVDASANRVSIGTSNNTRVFNVHSQTADSYMHFTNPNNTGNGGDIGLYDDGTNPPAMLMVNREAGGKIALSDNTNTFFDADSSEIAINENGGNIDFRVESDGNTHALYVDAALSTVGINTNSTFQTLTVNGNVAVGGAGNKGIYFGDNITSSADQEWLLANNASDSNSLNLYEYASGIYQHTRMKFASGGDMYINGHDNTSIVMNEFSNNTDFRVESNSDTHALFVDASTNRVGISTSAPPVQFTVGGGDGTAELMLWGNNTNSTSSRLIFGAQDPYTSEYIQFRYNSDSNLLQLETDTGFGVGKIVQFDRQYGRVTFNEDSAADADFRVESNGNTHALYVDASANTTLVKKSSKEGPTASALEATGSFDADTATIASGSSHDFPLYGAASAAMVLVHTCSSANTNANRADLLLINPRNSNFGGGNQIVTVSTAHGSTGTSQEPSVTFSSVASGNSYWLRVTPSNSAASNLIVSIREVSIMA